MVILYIQSCKYMTTMTVQKVWITAPLPVNKNVIIDVGTSCAWSITPERYVIIITLSDYNKTRGCVVTAKWLLLQRTTTEHLNHWASIDTTIFKL